MHFLNYTLMRPPQFYERGYAYAVMNTFLSKTIHEILNIKSINLITHDRAKSAWEHMKNNLPHCCNKKAE